MATRQIAPPAAMKFTPIDEDENVRSKSISFAALQRRRDEALAKCVPYGSAQSKSARVASELVIDLDAEIAEASRAYEAARYKAQGAIIEARLEGRVALIGSLLAKTEAAVADAVSLRDYDAVTAGLLGVAVGPHPLPGLFMVAAQVERVIRELDPQPEAPVPVQAGRRRVRLLTRFNDREALGQIRFPGDVADLTIPDADDAIARGFAEAVLVEA